MIRWTTYIEAPTPHQDGEPGRREGGMTLAKVLNTPAAPESFADSRGTRYDELPT